MARTGRPPKPTQLHRLQGTLNTTKHIRDRGKEPEAEGDLLEVPPAFLSDAQAAGWRYAVQHAPKGILRRIDRTVLFVWVEAEDRHQRAVAAQAMLDDRQPTTPFLIMNKKRGELTLSPYLNVITASAMLMLRAASELGFSPAARPRLATSNPGIASANDSPWKQLRVMQGGKA